MVTAQATATIAATTTGVIVIVTETETGTGTDTTGAPVTLTDGEVGPRGLAVAPEIAVMIIVMTRAVVETGTTMTVVTTGVLVEVVVEREEEIEELMWATLAKTGLRREATATPRLLSSPTSPPTHPLATLHLPPLPHLLRTGRHLAHSLAHNTRGKMLETRPNSIYKEGSTKASFPSWLNTLDNTENSKRKGNTGLDSMEGCMEGSKPKDSTGSTGSTNSSSSSTHSTRSTGLRPRRLIKKASTSTRAGTTPTRHHHHHSATTGQR